MDKPVAKKLRKENGLIQKEIEANALSISKQRAIQTSLTQNKQGQLCHQNLIYIKEVNNAKSNEKGGYELTSTIKSKLTKSKSHTVFQKSQSQNEQFKEVQILDFDKSKSIQYDELKIKNNIISEHIKRYLQIKRQHQARRSVKQNLPKIFHLPSIDNRSSNQLILQQESQLRHKQDKNSHNKIKLYSQHVKQSKLPKINISHHRSEKDRTFNQISNENSEYRQKKDRLNQTGKAESKEFLQINEKSFKTDSQLIEEIKTKMTALKKLIN